MLRLYFGQLGSGKTYTMMVDVFKSLKRGDDVYANFPIKSKKFEKQIFYVRNMDEIMQLNYAKKYGRNGKQATIALDEGWIFLDSYESTKMSKAVRIKLVSLRKHRLNLFITAQRTTALHKSCRDLVNEFWRIEKWINLPFFHLFRAVQYELDGMGNIDDTPVASKGGLFSIGRGIRIYRLKKKIATCYDTLLDIDEMFDIRLRNGSFVATKLP